MSERELWMAVHSHRFGSSAYVFWFAPTPEVDSPDLYDVITQLDIDYEPDNPNEDVEIWPLGLKEVPEVIHGKEQEHEC